MFRVSGIPWDIEIGDMEQSSDGLRASYCKDSFERIGVTKVWKKYDGILSWGEGQTVALVDDGIDLSVPEWQTEHPWGKKVCTVWNAVDQNNDPSHIPPNYHGTSIGYASSLCYQGVCGVVYRDRIIPIRAYEYGHLPQIEGNDITLARALNWVIEHAEKYNITAVNLSPVDDAEHTEPFPTVLDEPLRRLREMNIWVSSPCGNLEHTNGISWPACQENCFAISSVYKEKVYYTRYQNTDLLVHADTTSGANAYTVSAFMLWREAVEKTNFPWQNYGKTMPDAAMAMFKKTGRDYTDEITGITFKALDLSAVIDFIMEG